jgi:hypothetical protein
MGEWQTHRQWAMEIGNGQWKSAMGNGNRQWAMEIGNGEWQGIAHRTIAHQTIAN